MAEQSGFGWRINSPAGEPGKDFFKVKGLRELAPEEEEFACALRREWLLLSGEKGIAECLDSLSAREGIGLDSEQGESIKAWVLADAEAGGPLGILASDPEIEEIAVIGAGKPVFVLVPGSGWLASDSEFTGIPSIVDSINKLARPLGRRLTARSPRLNAALSNGCRIHASIPPLSDGEVTIRRFREEPFSPAHLVANRTFSAEAMAFLWLAVQSDSSLIVAGNTGSGKTSTLNSLFSFIPLSERILIIEETPEMRVPHAHSCRLVARAELGLGLGEISADSLRMRPDRVAIGEARDSKEARALFDSMLSGQAKGCFATIHARDSREAMGRLQALGIPAQDIASLDLIVVQRRITRFSAGKFSEVRRCTEISETSFAEGNARATRLYLPSPKSGALERASLGTRILEKACSAFSFTETEFLRELARRTRFIESLALGGAGFGECLAALSAYGGGSQ